MTDGCRAPTISWLIVLLGLSAHSSRADVPDSQALKRLSLEELSRIQVTSPGKAPEEASHVPMAIFVLTAEDIRRSGATTIPEALRLAPGVHVARIEGSKWSIGIRGFGSRLSRSVLVLIDGRTVYTTFFAGTYWEVQDTLLADIDRIEVIRGPGGTIWGPNAVNGVINIITKRVRDTQGAVATITSGNEEQGLAGFRYGGAAGANLHYRVYGKAFTRGPQYHDTRNRYDDWRGIQSGFRVDWDRNERDQFTFQGDIYRQENGQRVNVVSYTQPFSSITERNADLSGGNLMARWTRKLSRGATLNAQTFYDRTNRYEANFGESRDTFDIDFLVREPARRRNTLSWGAGIRASRGAATEVTSGLTFDPLTRTDYLLTGFIQDEIALVNDRLSLTLGSKFLRTNFATIEVEPSARLLWTPTRRDSFWGSFTRAVRTPSRAERDFYLSGFIRVTPDGVPFFARFNANGDFDTERLNGYELGFRRMFRSSLYVDIATYRNRYYNLFSQEITGSPFLENTPAPPHLLLPAQFRNGLEGATTGYEIAPEWRPQEQWRLRGAYSYLVMDLRRSAGSADIGTAPITERSSPRHQVNVQSLYTIASRFDLDLTFRAVSALPGQRIPRYFTGDARLAWRVRPEWEISVVGRNLFQPWHPESANDPGPPVGIRRTAYVRLTWTK